MSSASSRGAARALRRAASALTLCLATGAAMALSPVMQPPPPPQGKQPPPAQPPRWISVIAAEAQTPIRVRQATVQSRLSGSSAVSRVELTLFNPNARVLSGDLRFPLNAGQSVTGFALDINGVLRRAVPVEKAKGRQVYEDTVRGQVDPALLEVTEGNFYKLQVYPLPAGGTRRVVLEIRESLASPESTGPVWRLPLQFSGAVDQLSADVLIDGVAPRQLTASWGPEALPVSPTPEGGARITLRTRAAWQTSIAGRTCRLALELQVVDNGPGIAAELRERIFLPLVSGREGGTGLGLTLAQSFVQNHRGMIECESQPGRTAFRVLFPL